mgnify:FL=1
MRILLVDDHALFRDGMALLLKELDPAVQTVHAAHPGEALAALDHDTGIDLVLLDLILPGANGFQALETIRERHPGMPLVMLSSQEDQVTVLRAIQLGAMGFIPKSASSQQMFEALRTVLPKERTRRWQEQATELQTSIGAARDLMLLATLLEPLGIDRGILGFLRGVAAGRMAEA